MRGVSLTCHWSRECWGVYNLLGRNADVFSQGPADLGRTDSLPIRQPPRRLPSLKRDEAHKTVTEMLGQGLPVHGPQQKDGRMEAGDSASITGN